MRKQFLIRYQFGEVFILFSPFKKKHRCLLVQKLNINFIDGASIEIIEDTILHYKIEFIDRDTNDVIFELDLKSNQSDKCPKKYYVNWLIRINGIDNDFYYEYIFDLNRK